jgi:hypothetical protein
MLMLLSYKNIRNRIMPFVFHRNKLLAMNDEEQYSPFTKKGPQIAPFSSLSLRGADYPPSLRTNPEPVEGERSPTERSLNAKTVLRLHNDK